MSRVASSLRDELGAKLTEAAVLEKVEKVSAPPRRRASGWSAHLVEKGSALRMKFMGGKLEASAASLQDDAEACEDIVSDRDTDIAEALFTPATP